ncbi:MAG: molybdopterin molybdenumtransferase MoeA [Ectothiorhodospiraceae bacterium]|nr:molybdopterin molybdenumtransferase MoeA [Ectothiorhodospiraceae bacterium]
MTSNAPPVDCYTGDPELLPAATALDRVRALASPVADIETVPTARALGRVLADPVVSPLDVPAHTNSAMDGFAVAGTELVTAGERAFEVLGTAWAGRPFETALRPGTAVRIMTGAVMPPGADTVVMQEQTRLEGDRVIIGAGHRVGQNVRLAGEDVRAGRAVLPAGKRLGPAELGLIASLGLAAISARRRLRVATFSTGDELRSVGEPPAPGTVYDSNRYTLLGMLARLDVEHLDLGVIRDRPDELRAALVDAAARSDVVVTSGGASTGEADHVQATLRALGEVGFWRIAIRPGRPLAFGRIGQSLFFGLPGNPVAVMVTFYQFVLPALRVVAGEPWAEPVPALRARCVSRLRKKPGRVEYYRAVLERDEQGMPIVRHTGRTGSGLLHTMSDANCFIVLPEDGADVEPGAEVEVQPFHGLV